MKHIFQVHLHEIKDFNFESFEDSYEHADMVLAISFRNVDPTSVQEALSDSDSDKWREAMKDKYDSIYKNNCWTLTDLKKGQKPLKCK